MSEQPIPMKLPTELDKLMGENNQILRRHGYLSRQKEDLLAELKPIDAELQQIAERYKAVSGKIVEQVSQTIASAITSAVGSPSSEGSQETAD